MPFENAAATSLTYPLRPVFDRGQNIARQAKAHTFKYLRTATYTNPAAGLSRVFFHFHKLIYCKQIALPQPQTVRTDEQPFPA